MPLSSAPGPTPPPFEFHEGDFPNLIEFMQGDIASRTVPPQEVPPPPPRLLALARALRDNGVYAGEPFLYVPTRECDRAAATPWRAQMRERALNQNVFTFPGEDFVATFRAKTFITRLDHALLDETRQLGTSSMLKTFSFPCDLALLNALGVEDEISNFLEARGDALGVSVIPTKETSGFKISIQRKED